MASAPQVLDEEDSIVTVSNFHLESTEGLLETDEGISIPIYFGGKFPSSTHILSKTEVEG
jgi:hypothetical protein